LGPSRIPTHKVLKYARRANLLLQDLFRIVFVGKQAKEEEKKMCLPKDLELGACHPQFNGASGIVCSFTIAETAKTRGRFCRGLYWENATAN
jgi:hypothetical protein